MDNKRKISILIPYAIKDGNVLVFLQRRDKDAKRLPDYFGFFGGGAENDETPEETIHREIKEELDFTSTEFKYFKKYEFEGSIKDVFTLEVGNDFESTVTILEGQYGKWFSKEDIANEPKLIEDDKLVLREFYESLLRK